jgi:ElaB/YqjD/DUF883 family membrane-anchored ribosome-binding protein
MEQTNERAHTGAPSGEDIGRAGEDIRAKAGAVIDEARHVAEDQKSAAADNVVRLSRAFHGAADQLGKELPQAAGYVHSAADRLQSASRTLRERSVEDMVGDLGDFARRQPLAAFAGAVLAGFALSRFLKSSNSDHLG